ncbi:kynurenine formamidase [Coccinella septempunctata]|uniref:kynurenine formamidase n=1 Tax=Coccinella septempunctata TaxID=41139 RepID=UPI001D07C81A|nr:kynurenine formamidase [Coccinella septempunctata]
MTSEKSCDLELLYSPSKWCKRYNTSEECIQDHVKIISEESQVVRSSVPGNLEVSYGTLPKEKYDLFGIDLPNNSPIIFYIHGGYWQEECINRKNSSFLAKTFHKHGIKSFIIGYELCPDVGLDEIVYQTQKALRICLDYAKRKGSRGICLMGHSAGAHLVAHLFTKFVNTLPPEDVNLLRSAYLIGGIYDLEPLVSTSYNIPMKLTNETAKRYSPIHHRMSDCDTKFFIVVGKNDSPAFVAQSEMVNRRFESQNMATRLLVMGDIDHFDIIERLSDEQFKLTRMILKTLTEIY